MHYRVLLVAAAVTLGVWLIPNRARADAKEECMKAAEVGQTLRSDKKLVESREKMLTCSRDVCPPFVRTDCAKWLGEIDGSTPTVVIRARDEAGHDIVDVRVLIDNNEVSAKLTGSAIPVNPGEHVFRYERAGKDAIEDTILVAEGEKGRVLRVELGKPEETDPNNAHEKPAETTASHPSIAPWIIGGIGAAGVVAFAISEIMLQTEYSSLKSTCGKAGCTADQVSTAVSERTAAEVTLTVGVVGLAVAVPWIIVNSLNKPKPAAKPDGSALRFDFKTTPGGGMGVVTGRF